MKLNDKTFIHKKMETTISKNKITNNQNIKIESIHDSSLIILIPLFLLSIGAILSGILFILVSYNVAFHPFYLFSPVFS